MPDLTLCVQALCPLAPHCYRFKARRGHWQSMAAFEYVTEKEGTRCEYFIELKSEESTIEKRQKP